MENIINIDGSKYEGGGQMLRFSLALSTLLQQGFKMTNIRAQRPNPGINNQLKNQIDLIAPLVNAEVQGNKIGSLNMEFIPKRIYQPQSLLCKGNSAQSITLILQSLLPITVFSQSQSEIIIHGGTYVSNSPPITTIISGFCQVIEKMGIKIEIQVIKDGFYPSGGGIVKALVKPNKNIQPLVLKEVARIEQIKIVYLLAQPRDINKYDKQILKFAQIINPNVQLVSEVKVINSKKFKDCYGICCTSKSDSNIYDHSIIQGIDSSIDCVLEEVQKDIGQQLQNASAVDLHLQDQFLLFMALTKGKSEILINQITEHTKSGIYVLQQFIPNIQIEIQQINNKQYLLIVEGQELSNIQS